MDDDKCLCACVPYGGGVGWFISNSRVCQKLSPVFVARRRSRAVADLAVRFRQAPQNSAGTHGSTGTTSAS